MNKTTILLACAPALASCEMFGNVTPEQAGQAGAAVGGAVGGVVGGPAGVATGTEIGSWLGAGAFTILTALGVFKAKKTAEAKQAAKVETIAKSVVEKSKPA